MKTTIPEALHEAIETERDQLRRAYALLACLATAMEYSEPGHATEPDYGEVVRMAGDLVRSSINNLDSMNLDKALR
jgi:hypothetical protein